MDRMRPTAEEVSTTCPYCGVGCGVLVKPDEGGEAATVRGNPDHPANFGRLCSKGSALGETLDLDERQLFPTISGERASWDSALDKIGNGFSEAIATHGPDSVALYVSGQILTEDYYVANKLMKGFVGSANIDTNSRLCMASSVAGHKRAFGSDTVPGCYEDLERADLVVMVGSNLAWCHPVLHNRILAAREKRGTRLVIIDPRKTATTDAADLHLPIRPGADVLLFNALFAHLAASDAHDTSFVNAHTKGLDAALDASGPLGLAELSIATALPKSDLRTFFQWVEQTPATVTIYSQGVNQSSAGSDKVNAIINCHLVTGRIGKPGCGPFSVTGQPNAMGGREVGGLANQLAAHIDYSDKTQQALVGEFWQAPNLVQQPGFKAVELFDAIERGEVKAVWIVATNPVVSMPQADRVKAALARCPLVIVSDMYQHTDTLAFATIKLPALGWSEKDGTVTNSERCISRQRALLPAPGQAKADWQIICDVARAMGFSQGFNFSSAAQIFAEHAALSGYKNKGQRAFNISALANLSAAQYQQLNPVQWPVTEDRLQGTARLFADGEFFTASGKAQFVAVYQRTLSLPSAATPLLLNSGRLRDQWHTMTRTGRAVSLMQHYSEPFVTLHPADAALYGIAAGDFVQLSNASGQMLVRAEISDSQRSGETFVPMHWSAQFASQARADVLFAAHTDPISGQPALKLSQVALRRMSPDWQILLFTREPLSPEQQAVFSQHYLARMPLANCQSYRVGLMAGLDPMQLVQQLQFIPGVTCRDSRHDALTGYRAAAVENKQLQWVIMGACRLMISGRFRGSSAIHRA